MTGRDPRATRAFYDEAKRWATSWKRTTSTIPDQARRPGGGPGGRLYDHLLPSDCREFNLLPAVRFDALQYCRKAGIPWHQGTEHAPTNNLLDSQVQCFNVLSQGLDDPDYIAGLFSPWLPIDRVLPWPDGKFIAFEWIGTANYLREPEQLRRRGSYATSADAAIRYASAGGEEIALVEWKYVEGTYDPELRGDVQRRMALRRPFFYDATSPFKTDLVPFEDLFVDPIHQLLRLGLLADQMEREHELGASIVRVCWARPEQNADLRTQLRRESLLALGAYVDDVYREMLISRDRFVSIDTADLLEGAMGLHADSRKDLRERYGHLGKVAL